MKTTGAVIRLLRTPSTVSRCLTYISEKQPTSGPRSNNVHMYYICYMPIESVEYVMSCIHCIINVNACITIRRQRRGRNRDKCADICCHDKYDNNTNIIDLK